MNRALQIRTLLSKAEAGMTTHELRDALGAEHGSLLSQLAWLRSKGRSITIRCGRFAMHVATCFDPAAAIKRFEEVLKNPPPMTHAQFEQRKAAADRSRLNRQAKVGEKPTVTQRQRTLSKASTKAANVIAKRIKNDGTHERKPKPAPAPATTSGWDGVKVQKIAHQPGRYEVLTVEPVFSGKALLPATSCMARALS
jgi:hypothetical protein